MTKKEVAEYLGVSDRAVNRYTAAGKLSVTFRKSDHGPMEGVYSAAEVKKLKRLMSLPKPERDISTALVRVAGGSSSLQTRGLPSPLITQIGAAIVSQVPIQDKLSLTLAEAAKLSGYSRDYLRRAIKAGKLKAAIRGRGWNIKREDLEAWVKKL